MPLNNTSIFIKPLMFCNYTGNSVCGTSVCGQSGRGMYTYMKTRKYIHFSCLLFPKQSKCKTANKNKTGVNLL